MHSSTHRRLAQLHRLGILPLLLALLLSLGLAPGQLGPAALAAAPTPGTVYAWGSDQHGQLGDGTAGASASNVQMVPGTTDIVAVAAGEKHSLALKADGTLLAWGDDTYGQLGDGTAKGEPGCDGSCNPTPQPVPGMSGVVAIAAGQSHSLALKADGTLLAWGQDLSGQLGDGSTDSTGCACHAAPQPVPGVSGIVAIAAGGAHTLVLKADGTLLAWGNDTVGQMGDGTAGGNVATPQPVPGISGIIAVAAGGFHSLALRADGTLIAWGDNSYGHLGGGTAGGFTATPQLVPGVTDGVAVAAGSRHSLALKADGTLLAWGLDTEGQLGDGSAATGGCLCHAAPQPVPGVSGVAAIDAGSTHSLALKVDGTLLAWGRNDNGQLGGGSAGSNAATPQPVSGATGVVAIAAGLEHNLLIGGMVAPPAETTTAAAAANATYGAATVTLSASVTSTNTVNGGTVTFTVKGPGSATTVVGTATSGAVSDGNASATFTLPPGTPVGSYTIEASYSGADGFAASSDPTPAALTITKAATSAAIGTPATALSCGASSVTIPVTVTNTSNAAALTGGTITVTLTQGATTLGTATVAFGTPPVASPATVGVTVAVSGAVIGNATVNASYSGDGNFQGSAATPATLAIPKTATGVTVPTATATYGDGSVTLTATVTSTNGAALTGGTITFRVKKGNQVLTTLPGVQVSGSASVTTSVTLPLSATFNAGNYTIEASYSGNACFNNATGTGTLTVARKIVMVKPQDRTVGLRQPNPPTTPPANCLAQATATSACWLELANGSTFAYGQSWSALNLANLRFQYSRNPPSTNASEYVGKTYRITAFGVSSPNYDIRYEPGTLRVVAAP